jgi:V-type H+-transporting ATPase subunit D
MTNRRVNAIEYIIIPKVENTIRYIQSELDEQDREEFYRLKKIQGKKKIARDIEEQLRQQLNSMQANGNNHSKNYGEQQQNGRAVDLLNMGRDEDLIF